MKIFNLLFPTNATWTRMHNGYRVSSRDATVEVSNSELDAQHPWLTAGICTLFEPRPQVHNELVKEMVDVWMSTIHVRTMDGSLVCMSKIDNVEVKSSLVFVLGLGIECKLKKHPQSGDMIPIPVALRTARYAVANDWLDAERPGWRERYDAALAIGMEIEGALEAMLLHSKVSSEPNLPDSLSF